MHDNIQQLPENPIWASRLGCPKGSQGFLLSTARPPHPSPTTSLSPTLFFFHKSTFLHQKLASCNTGPGLANLSLATGGRSGQHGLHRPFRVIDILRMLLLGEQSGNGAPPLLQLHLTPGTVSQLMGKQATQKLLRLMGPCGRYGWGLLGAHSKTQNQRPHSGPWGQTQAHRPPGDLASLGVI